MVRRTHIVVFALVLCVAIHSRSGIAQSPPPCVPSVEIMGTPPPRLLSRMRALVRTLPDAPAGVCRAPRVQVTWTPQQLSIAVSLDDGRIASRTLHSIEDVLPTLLAVLVTPSGSDGSTVDPSVESQPRVRPPPAVIDDEELPADPFVAPRRREVAHWGIYARGELGLTTPVATGDSLFMGGGEAGVSHGGLRLSLRGMFGSDSDRGRASENGAAPRASRDTSQLVVVLSVTQRVPLGRFGVEVGGVIGVSRSTALDNQGGTLDDLLALRAGVSSALVLPVALGIEVYLRGELTMDLRPESTAEETVALAGMLSLGAGWGSAR